MKRLTADKARQVIASLYFPHKVKVSDTPERKAAFLDEEAEARFFGDSWESVVAEAARGTLTSPSSHVQ